MRPEAALVLMLVGLAAPAGATQPMHSVPQTVPGAEPPQPLMTRQVLFRGQERYDIFCAPCHGFAGDGDGMVVQRGFPAPPSFHVGPRVDLTAGQIVEVISQGSGLMLPMAERIPVTDRWAIAAYVKALQLSRQAPGEEQ
jgi:mono/diheme cytochrome c family protein